MAELDRSLNKQAELRKEWLATARPASALDPEFPYEDEFVANAIVKSPMPFDNIFRAKITLRET